LEVTAYLANGVDLKLFRDPKIRDPGVLINQFMLEELMVDLEPCWVDPEPIWVDPELLWLVASEEYDVDHLENRHDEDIIQRHKVVIY